jgi:hypothetical protein
MEALEVVMVLVLQEAILEDGVEVLGAQGQNLS